MKTKSHLPHGSLLVKYGIAFLLILGTTVATINHSKAQGTAQLDNDKIYASTDKTPQFAGGMQKLYEFIANNIKYPREMKEKNIQGTAILQFIVEKDGALSNIKSIRDPGYGSGDEAIRVLGLSPKWIPGEQNGKAVRVQFNLPIRFTLGNNSKPPAQK